MVDVRSDPTFTSRALTREEYMEIVERIGRPLNWGRCWFKRRDVAQDNSKWEAKQMEGFQ